MTSTSTITLRLDAIKYAAKDINLFEFVAPEAVRLPDVDAGSHIGLHLPNGMVRQYSLLHAGNELDRYTIAVKREDPGTGGSRYIHDELRVGTQIEIDPPRNNFPLIGSATHAVLIGGGIGITPIYCIMETLSETKRSFELHYACRSRVDAILLDRFQVLDNVSFHFDDEAAGRFLDIQAIVSAVADNDAQYFCCGPVGMLEAFREATAGLPTDNVHVEYFTTTQELATEGGFVVELAKSGRSFVIEPGQTILQVLLDAGLDLPHSCEQGVCGSCETAVLGGIPDHRDMILTDGERTSNQTMMICCSGCKTDKLVLDI